jgi:uncharacterized protein (PEP-CTERM system associated)
VTPAITANVNGSYQFQVPDAGAHFATGRGLAGGTVALGPDGTLSLLGGVSLYATEGQETKVRPSGSLAYTQRFATFVLSARFESGYVNNSSAIDATGVTFTRSAGVFLTTTQLLFRELTATLGVRWVENQFEQSSTFGGPPGTKDRTWDFDASLSYPLARSLSLGLGYTGTIRTSTQSSADFYENRVRLGLTYQYNLL